MSIKISHSLAIKHSVTSDVRKRRSDFTLRQHVVFGLPGFFLRTRGFILGNQGTKIFRAGPPVARIFLAGPTKKDIQPGSPELFSLVQNFSKVRQSFQIFMGSCMNFHLEKWWPCSREQWGGVRVFLFMAYRPFCFCVYDI